MVNYIIVHSEYIFKPTLNFNFKLKINVMGAHYTKTLIQFYQNNVKILYYINGI